MDVDRNSRRNPSLTARVVWLLFNILMYLWAVTGPFAVVIGTLSFFVDWIDVKGGTQEKLIYISSSAVFGAVGLTFVWLRWAGYLVFGDEIPPAPRLPRETDDWTEVDVKEPDPGEFQAGPPPS